MACQSSTDLGSCQDAIQAWQNRSLIWGSADRPAVAAVHVPLLDQVLPADMLERQHHV